eukprot:8318909-Alexandrium_andersonii.AAC.1
MERSDDRKLATGLAIASSRAIAASGNRGGGINTVTAIRPTSKEPGHPRRSCHAMATTALIASFGSIAAADNV